MHTAHFILHTVYCILHTAYCILHTAHCTLHTSSFRNTELSAKAGAMATQVEELSKGNTGLQVRIILVTNPMDRIILVTNLMDRIITITILMVRIILVTILMALMVTILMIFVIMMMMIILPSSPRQLWLWPRKPWRRREEESRPCRNSSQLAR